MLSELNPLFHARLRLTIMSFLVAKTDSDFTHLKEITKATAGNLSVQLKKLEEAGCIKITKGFKGNYQHTKVSITKKGITEFEIYVKALRTYIE